MFLACGYNALTRLIQITPNPKTPAGYAARSDIFDIVDIFEINRKECARLLVEYPKWTPAGTFKPRTGGPVDNTDHVVISGKDWQLESSVVEVRARFCFQLQII
jgi:nuclear cap-binding protein subunit 1